MLFITKYIDGTNAFGGMVRVKDIERLCKKPSFLTISLGQPMLKKSFINSSGNRVDVVGFLRFFAILKLLCEANAIYFHTVGNFIKASIFLPFIDNKKWFIDLHGAQPEEFKYLGKPLLSTLFRLFEKIAFSTCNYYIHVSNNMIQHFRKIYPNARGMHLYAPILSPNIDVTEHINLNDGLVKARLELGLDEATPVFLYSGGVQKWQKVDDIISFSSKALDRGFRVIILSAQEDVFRNKLNGYLSNNKLLITSVPPERLSTYYLAANFGIMFRDENTLNTVSSPTKMSEYMYYGMIPVLTSLNVGDFVSLGIDYIEYDGNNIDIKNVMVSKKNHDLICQLICDSDFKLLGEVINEK